MKISIHHFILVLIIALSNPFRGTSQDINKNSSLVTFEISNLGINMVDGTIKGFEGSVVFDPEDMSKSSFRVCIDPATINSGISARDEELLEEDYFNVEKYPGICFSSDDIIKTDEGFLTTGTLILKGVSREVTIPFVVQDNRLKGSLEINRTDYGVGPSGGFLVGKTVELEIICVLETSNPR